MDKKIVEPRNLQAIKSKHLKQGSFNAALFGLIALLFWLFRIGTDGNPPAPLLIAAILIPIFIVWEFVSFTISRSKADAA